MVKKESFSDSILSAASYFIVILMVLLCLIPVINTVAISLSESSYAMAGKVTFYPIGFTLSSYTEIINDKQFFKSFSVSVMRVLLGGMINMAIIVITAYPLSRSPRYFRQKKIYIWFLIFTMLFNGGLIPTFLLVKSLGLIDTIWALVLPGAVKVTNVILMMNFFKEIPEELNESARIDGAPQFTIFARIYLPLAVPGIATLSLFTIMEHWNAFFDGIIYIKSFSKVPLQTYILQLTSVKLDDVMMSEEEMDRVRKISSKTFNAAKVFVTMIPILIIYPFLQKYFVKGLVVGSVKG